MFEVRAVPPLRLAVDARVISEDTRGIGRYARAVLRRLLARTDVALTLLADGPFAQRSRQPYARALGEANFSVRRAPGRDLDVIWHPANGTFFASALPSVATIHDAVPFRYPDRDTKRRAHAQDPFRRSARTANRIIAVSQFGRDELHAMLAVPLERIEVIAHGVESSFSPGTPEPLPTALRGSNFLLFVGDPIGEPRKNFPLLYEAYRDAWPEGDGPLLAVAGPRAPDWAGVVHAGNFGDDLSTDGAGALRACYRAATALVIPSFHETFGMPMLEAMACATPVVASAAGSLPEIGGDAALYAPPHDSVAWSVALRTVCDDAALRARLREAGPAHTQRFSWDESARRHYELFASLVE